MVPLGFVEKGVVRNLDTAGPNGEPLPVLGKEENARLAFAALAYEFEREGGELTTRNLDLITQVVAQRPDEALAAVCELFPDRNEVEHDLKFGGFSGPLIDLAEDLARNFLLVGLVPRDIVGTRTVLKFSFDWTAILGSSDAIRRSFASAGYRRHKLLLDIGDPSWARSYHLEVRVQLPLIARSLTLPAMEHFDQGPREEGSDTLIHATGSYPFGPPAQREAELEVSVAPTSIRSTAALVSLFTAVVFNLAIWLPGARRALLEAPDGAVAILLAVPAAGIALLTGTGESTLSSSLLRPLRVITLTCAGLLMLGGASLVGHLHSPWFDMFWELSACWSAVTAAALAIPLAKVRIK